MSFYDYMVKILRLLFRILNGKPKVIGKEHLTLLDTNGPLIIAATHRSFLDPFYLALEFYPHKISFMGKEDLFQNKILATVLRKALVFPVNREKPSPKTIKIAVQKMTKEHLNLGIFPSGSRYETQIKGGTAFIQKLSKKAILPVAIQPPKSFWAFLKHRQAKIAIGQAIPYQKEVAYDKEYLSKIDQLIAESFDQLDRQLDPNYHYIPERKP